MKIYTYAHGMFPSPTRRIGCACLLTLLACGMLFSASAQTTKTRPTEIKKTNTDPTLIAKLLAKGNLTGTVAQQGFTTPGPDLPGLWFDLTITVGNMSTKITESSVWHCNSSGHYRTTYNINDLPAGTYKVVMKFTGSFHGMTKCISPLTKTVVIQKNKTSTANFTFNWKCHFGEG